MIDKNYSKNYIKIYFWRSLTITSGLLSLFIVIPFLSKDQELFGIYTFCIAFTLYLTYADIGFLAAGQKYAAEQFVKGNRNEEMGILGFIGIILILMFLPFSIAMIYFSIHPNMILNYPVVDPFDKNNNAIEIASNESELKKIIKNKYCIPNDFFNNYIKEKFDFEEVLKIIK